MFVRFMNYLKYKTKYLKRSQTLVLIIIIIIIIIYQTNIVPKVSFIVASDIVPNVYNKPRIYGGDYYLSMRLMKFETLDRAFTSTCKLENLKIARNGHQHTKITEDEEVF